MSFDIKCNECWKLFKFMPLTRQFNDVDIVYIECPHCEHRFLSYVQDDEIKYRMTKSKKMAERLQDENLDARKRMKQIEKAKKFNKRTGELMEKKQEEYSDLIAKVIQQKKS